MQIGFSKQISSNRLGEKIIICTSRFLSDVIEKSVFDKNAQLEELYRSQN
jgi:hypothetical protein